MASSEVTNYRFTVKEGSPDVSGEAAPTYLLCEPTTKNLEFLGDEGFLTIELPPGTSVERAQEIATYLDANVAGIGIMRF